jgi:hypothetical protein
VKPRHFADLILAGGGILALSALAFFLYYYGWTGERQFTSFLAGALHYTVLAGVAGFLFASLRFRPKFKITLAIFCISLSMSLYAAEILASRSSDGLGISPFWGLEQGGLNKKPAIAALKAAGFKEIDTRAPAELVLSFSERRVNAVPAIMLGRILSSDGTAPTSYAEAVGVHASSDGKDSPAELMPLGGVAGNLTVLCNESGQYVTYESDEHGFRNPGGIWSLPHTDVATLGESFIQGYCVPDGKDFVDLLRQHYPSVLNLGMSGQSSLLQLAAMKEYLTHYKPKIVLWFFCEGIDLHDLNDESHFPLLMRYLEPGFSQQLLARQPEIDGALRKFISETYKREGDKRIAAERTILQRALEIVKFSNLREKLGMVYGVDNKGDYDEAEALSMLDESKRHLLIDTLTQAQTLAHGWGGSLYFVYLPSWYRYGKDSRIAEIERTKTFGLVDGLGIPIIDVHHAFRAQKDPLNLFPIRKFGHYNELGNEIVADTVLQFLSKHEVSMAVAAHSR